MNQSPIYLESVIRQDMPGVRRRMKNWTIVSSLAIGLGFLGFAASSVIGAISGDFIIFGLIPVFFVMFTAGALGLSFFSVRSSASKRIINYIKAIKEHESISIVDASNILDTDIGNTLFITRELIKNKNLEEYEIVDKKFISLRNKACVYCGRKPEVIDSVCKGCGYILKK